ncbi:MAG TPA: hypothetical protein VFN92_12130 [Solirubrobacterales bacterium]|nr:hypothetical protein [Solirubrobacterales bacterium]
MPDTAEAYDEAYDEDYSEAYDGESSDEARLGGPRRIVTARPTPLPPRPAERPVTQAQLQTAVNKLNGDISRNSTAIQRVNTSVTALGRDVRRQSSRARDARKDIGQLRDALVIMPLLSSTMGAGNPMMSALLPMLMLSGIGESAQAGSSGSSGGMLGGDQTTMMMLVMAMSGAFGKGS